jgi:hypothetical protein
VCLVACWLQMVKPRERNTRYVDAVMTVPKGTLYPMCGMNLAFDRWGHVDMGQREKKKGVVWSGACGSLSSAPSQQWAGIQ